MRNLILPVTVLTGFLGSGKTSLINRILKGDHGKRIAVLVNDFGRINIDEMLISSIDGNIVSLENGCACCSLANDLVMSFQQVLPLRPDHIFVEASGVANPYAIVRTIQRPALRESIRLDSVITMVDAAEFLNLCAADGNANLRNLIADQITIADIIIVNKIDLVSDTELDEVKRQVQQIARWARLIATSHADIPIDIILIIDRKPNGFSTYSAVRADIGNHHDLFDSWSFVSDRPFSLSALQKQLSQLPTSVLRAKGVLMTTELPDEKIILQQVGIRSNFTHGGAWARQTRRSQLVLIGLVGSLDKPQLQYSFECCLSG